jgi:hypothetical protein
VSEDGQGPPTDGGETPRGEDAREAVGTVAEEAAKLFGALSDWAREEGSDLGQGMSGLAGHAARTVREVDEHLATGAEECTYCPICRGVHLLRRTSPEVRAHLATAASSLMQAAAGLLATAVPEQHGTRTGVEHIDLDDDVDGDGDDGFGGDLEDWPEDGGAHETGPEGAGPEEGDR